MSLSIPSLPLGLLGRGPRTLSSLMSAMFGASEPGFHYEAYDPDSIVARRNRLTYSEVFSNAAWVRTNILSITDNADGVGDLVVPNTTLGGHTLIQTIPVVPGIAQVVTVRAKPGGYDWLAFSAGSCSAYVNVATGAAGSLSAGVACSTSAVAGVPGYYDVVITFTPATASSFTLYVASANGTVSFAGDGVSGLYLARAQLEQGTAATAYQAVTDWNTEFIAQGGDAVALYQDSVGTLACTTREDPVGLILDRRFMGAVGADVKATGVVALTGAATPATYNTSTGAGTASRVDAANQSSVVLTAGVNVLHRFRILVAAGGGSLIIREGTSAGTILTTLAAGFDGVVHLRPGIANFALTCGVVATATFTLTSCVPVPGTHATQSTSTMRALLTARVNQLTKVGQLADAAWTKAASGVGITPTVTDYFNSEAGVSRVQCSLGGGVTSSDLSTVSQIPTSVTGAGYVGYIEVKANGAGEVGKIILFRHAGASAYTLITLTADWQVVRTTEVATGASYTYIFGLRGAQGASATADFLVRNQDARTADDAAKSIPAYQYVNTSSDYDGTGFPWRFREDGTDDFYTGTLDLSGTNKVTVIGQPTKRSDAAAGVFFEHTANSSSTPAPALFAPGSAAANYAGRSGGTVASTATTGNTYAAPISNILTLQGDVSTDRCDFQVNNDAVVQSATDQGTGNYPSAAFYIASRGGTTLRMAGDWSSLTVRGADTPEALKGAMKRYQRALAFLSY